MKKFYSVLLALFAFFFFGCEFLDEFEIIPDTEDTWHWRTSNNSFVVGSDISSVTISGELGGKKLYYALVNTSDSIIDSKYVKYPASSSAFDEIIDFRSAALSSNSFEDSYEDLELPFFNSDSDTHTAHFAFKPKKPRNFSRSASATDSLSRPAKSQILSYEVGSTAKTFNIVTGKNSGGNDVYTDGVPGTLRAYNDTCNVWVIDDYYTDGTEADGKINSSRAEKIAAKFESLYPLITNVFGYEFNGLLDDYSETEGFLYSDLDEVCDTGSKINIVIYDLYGDTTRKDVLGFFWSGDYYSAAFEGAEHSNEGKYFYIDSYAAIDSFDTVISTLAHEFQHMIHFAQKDLYFEGEGESDTNFNEMLSMLCEDMMQSYLGLADKDSPKGRLPEFELYYMNSGIRSWGAGSASYANAYAFGSWLCRQYGGAALLQQMMENDYVNNECFVKAVNSLNGTDYDFDDLFAQFVKACLGDSDYTFNKAASQKLTYSDGYTNYKYPMTAINLFGSYGTSGYKKYMSSAGYYDDISSAYTYYGPVILKSGVTLDLPATWGMTLHYYGQIPSGIEKLTLNFTSSSAYTRDGMKVVLYIK